MWPLSNDLCSKQYLKLVNSVKDDGICSMLQRVWEQLDLVNLTENAVIAASASQIDIIRGQVGTASIAVEPERRDTLPAVMLACSYIKSNLSASLDDYVTIMPVDPYTDIGFFKQFEKLEEVLKKTDASIGLIGAKPTYPSEKYGYIVPEKEGEGCIYVREFKEKPSLHQAEELIEQGSLWNCGVFCFRLSLAEEYLKKQNIDFQYEAVVNNYSNLVKNSFDYEILEKTKDLVAVEYDGMWKDLGTWNTLTEEMSHNVMGKGILNADCSNTHIVNMLDIPIIVMGAKDMIVAASHDGILVSDKYQSSFLKESLKEITELPRFEERRWGNIKIVDIFDEDGIVTITKRVKILAGLNTSYHAHYKQSENIIVISGEGEIVFGCERQKIMQGDTLRIPKGVYYAIKADTDLRLVEMHFGKEFGDEIDRKEYDWKKIEKEYIR